METTFHKLRSIVNEAKCPECGGLGECNDAEPGDIFCRTWVCGECHGTGMNKSVKQVEELISSLSSAG